MVGRDVNTWQTGASGSFWDMPYAISKVVLMRNNITLVLGFDQTQVLAGDIPPPGGNLQRRYLFDIGCIDPRSVVTYQDNVIWANTAGVWRTDAVSAYDVTDRCGLVSSRARDSFRVHGCRASFRWPGSTRSQACRRAKLFRAPESASLRGCYSES